MNAEAIYTFAYGMNMRPDNMTGARDGQKAWLHGYTLEYRGFADVAPDDDSIVPGVVWRITPGILRALDAREGYPSLYGRTLLNIECAGGAVVEAWVYRMTDDTVRWYASQGDRYPGESYMRTMRLGREAFGHPTDDLPAEQPMYRV